MFKKDNKAIKLYRNRVREIKDIKLSALKDYELLQKSGELYERACRGETLDALLVEAFALVYEAAYRVLRLKAYDEQLMAGIAMHEGNLVEMQTGEGKTLAAVFPAYLNALTRNGVNIFTHNDYLAKRDATLMGPVFAFLGMSVGFIQENMNRQERQEAYAYAITYATAKEAGFDYLRNFLCYDKKHLIKRSFNFIIVDEADSLLIDEARIPLVIAASGEPSNKSVEAVRETICKLEPNIDYIIDDNKLNVKLTDTGINFIEEFLECGNLYAPENLELLSDLLNALEGEVLFHKDIDYIVKDGKIQIVDELTGRTAYNRHWPDGIQAAIETKEGIGSQAKGRIMNQITLQNFIMLHKKIAGMTGTAIDAAEEFRRYYDLDTIVIPTHRPCIRVDKPNVVFTHKAAKYEAIFKEIEKVHKTGQPILIGTSSIRESIFVAGELKKLGITPEVLNAKNDELEAHIIEQAAARGMVTVSTNMAGRGTDIKLGGAHEVDRDKVVELGGLYIIGTSIYESHRIDKQLRGRAARQGDPGLSQFFISLEDDLIVKYGVENVLPRNFKLVNQDNPITNTKILNGIEHLRRIVRGKNLNLRQWLMRYSYIIEQQKAIVQNRRMEILLEVVTSNKIKEKEVEIYLKLKQLLSENEIRELEKQVTLFYIDKCWSDYLDYMLDIRDVSYLAVLRGGIPANTFEAEAVKSFVDFQDRVEQGILTEFKTLEITLEGINALKERMAAPSSTWTYLLKDNSFDGSLAVSINSVGFTAFAIIYMWPVMLITMIFEQFKKNQASKNIKKEKKS
jgi:preprotein translocase subunit SecA